MLLIVFAYLFVIFIFILFARYHFCNIFASLKQNDESDDIIKTIFN